MSATDALAVARFMRPGVKVEVTSCLGVWGARYEDGEEWFYVQEDNMRKLAHICSPAPKRRKTRRAKR